jgi:hypothetical protein
MGYWCNWQVFLTSFSTYILLFGHEPELPTSIQHDVMEIIDLDDSDVVLGM